MSLKTDYKDAIPATPQRKYVMVDNGDGTVSFQDVTEYSQVGDRAGASVFNGIGEEVNYKSTKSTPATATLHASGWTGTEAPYSITVTVAGAKPEPTRIEVQPTTDATAAQWAAWRTALVRGGGQGTDSITLLADGDKPEIDIPIAVTIRGDVS